MFYPGGVLHAALRVALRRSHECFLTGSCAIARGVLPRQARDDKSPSVPSRASPKQSEGGIGGKKRKGEPSPRQWSIYSFVRANIKSQAAPAAGSKVETQHAASLRIGMQQQEKTQRFE